jgi:hypothetical protein
MKTEKIMSVKTVRAIPTYRKDDIRIMAESKAFLLFPKPKRASQ